MKKLTTPRCWPALLASLAALSGASVCNTANAQIQNATASAFDQPNAPQTFGMPGLPVDPAAQRQFVPLSKQLGAAPQRVPVVSLPIIDHNALLAEDLRPDAGKKPLRVGIARGIQVAARDGVWTVMPDGGWLWTCDIRSEGAYGVRVKLDDLTLPSGSQLVAFNPDATADSAGPYEGRGDRGDGSQYTPIIWADTVRLELYLPPGANNEALPFTINTVQHIYRDPAKSGPATPRAGDPVNTPRVGNCHIDVACQPAWSNQARAVAIYYFSDGAGTGQCTGQLISTTTNDLTPYFLTASHCVDSEAGANTVDAYWLYQTPTCNGVVPVFTSLSRTTGATLVATRAQCDGTLLRLTGALPGGLFYMGWNSATPANSTAVAGIHHPDGSWKRISLGTVTQSSTCSAAAGQLGSESLRVDWTSGVTEGGSSGSGIMTNDANKQLVGTLSCGSSACGAASNLQNDTYGRFSSFYPTIQTFLNGFTDDSLEPNDSCAAARVIDITSPQSYTGLVVKAVDTDWYRFTLPAGTQLSVATSFTAATGNIDMRLFPTCGGTQLAQSVGTTGTETITYANSSASSVDVYLNVFISGTSPLNTYAMTASRTTALTNDACANAIPLTANTTITGTNIGATVDGTSACVTTQQPDVWYSFTAPAAGQLQIDTCGSAVDTVVSILNNGCGGTSLACNDDATSGVGPCGSGANRSSYVAATLSAGQSVRVRVATFNGTAQGAFNLRNNFVPTAPPPSNDTCLGATTISAGSVGFNTAAATTEGTTETLCNAFGHDGIDKDVWYAFVAPTAGTLVAETCGTGFDTKIASYATCPGTTPNTALDCDDDASPACTTGSTLASRLTDALTAGQRILLRVGGYRNASGTVASGAGTLTLTFTPSGPTPCGLSDVAGPGQAIGVDGALTADDIIVYLNWFFAGDSRSDVAGPGQSTTPDAAFTADDIIVFLNRFFAGC